MGKVKDLTNQAFGRLIAIDVSHIGKNKHAYWNCVCVCGATKKILSYSLISGRTRSCGCLKKDLAPRGSMTHGMARSSEYKIWLNMKDRCFREVNSAYKNYGGRGIGICSQWASFEIFYKDMGARPSKNHSIDRIDNNKGYCLKNCRWADRVTQSENRRNNRDNIGVYPSGTGFIVKIQRNGKMKRKWFKNEKDAVEWRRLEKIKNEHND